ncbi:hypothetical protein [Hymenobacter properus]|uniref:Uncharacterized protein n=1 Tax=Hymenobacter properus TaxID=2791026 RepID=A0A931BIH1_9BACT|nr:hypothetical protein [Hymenobacter properus]MBF9144515.1 hypothetical protein [Hymenobacter properus]MBR7723333.1 hypothetical protein [Microvirga sp. SRT04]
MQNTTNIPTLNNQSLAGYVSAISTKYADAEFYKEKMRDSGHGEGPTLLLTICKDDEILEEESFFYANQSKLDEDLKNLVFYLNFA